MKADVLCPCITDFPESIKTSSVGIVGNDTTTQCLKYIPHGTSDMYCYPLTYGLQHCSAWDMNRPPGCMRTLKEDGRLVENVNNAPWCEQPWCYVNKENCRIEGFEGGGESGDLELLLRERERALLQLRDLRIDKVFQCGFLTFLNCLVLRSLLF